MLRQNNRLVWSGVVAFALMGGLSSWRSLTAKEPAAADRAGEAVPAAAQQPKEMAEGTLSTKDLSLAQAAQVIEEAVEKAMAMGKAMDIAVVDAGGNLKGFARMDGAWLGSIDVSIRKARTARYFDMPTGELGKLSQPGGPLYNIEHSNGGLITFPGGVPIKDADGTIIGAIGVSGSAVEDDHAVATAGAAAVGKQ